MLHLQGLAKQFGSKVLFENADAHLGHRSKVALIGPNGAGKSTLIKMILGLEFPDSGKIVRANSLSIGYLPQDLPRMEAATVLQETLRMDGRRGELVTLRGELERTLEKTPDDAASLERYGRVLEELAHLDEYRLEARAKSILMGMGFREADFGRSLTEFSGGWLMRVALSRILLMDPDLLLLDEPTNHLDLETILWLEQFLKRFQGAMLLISHDTAFVNRLVSDVIEIDQRKLFSYRGNLEAYATQKAERLEVLKAQAASQEAKIADMMAFVDRFGAKATKARQAQSRLKQIEKMERIELPEDRKTVRFRFPPAPHSGREVVTAKGASVRYGDHVVFRDLNWIIRRGTRTAIVGPNGAGKTTLLKVISETISPSAGEIKHGHQVKVGYYAQMQAETLDPRASIVQELERVAPDMPVAQVRAIAGAFLFSGDAVEKRCSVLSGGEKARVALAKLLLQPSNFLILDEPTNHLDVESRGVLLDALADYEGTLCLVSHDRDFVAPLVDTVLEIQPRPSGGSEVVQLVGGYDEYIRSRVRDAEAQVKGSQEPERETATPPEAAKARTAPSNNQVRTWERERDQAERDIARLEREKAELEAKLADTATYEDKALTLEVMEKQRKVALELNERLSAWETVCEKLESIGR